MSFANVDSKFVICSLVYFVRLPATVPVCNKDITECRLWTDIYVALCKNCSDNSLKYNRRTTGLLWTLLTTTPCIAFPGIWSSTAVLSSAGGWNWIFLLHVSKDLWSRKFMHCNSVSVSCKPLIWGLFFFAKDLIFILMSPFIVGNFE